MTHNATVTAQITAVISSLCWREMMSYLCISTSQVVVLMLKKAITDLLSPAWLVWGLLWCPRAIEARAFRLLGNFLFCSELVLTQTDMAWLTVDEGNISLVSSFVLCRPQEQNNSMYLSLKPMRWCHPHIAAFMIITINKVFFWTTSSYFRPCDVDARRWSSSRREGGGFFLTEILAASINNFIQHKQLKSCEIKTADASPLTLFMTVKHPIQWVSDSSCPIKRQLTVLWVQLHWRVLCY